MLNYRLKFKFRFLLRVSQKSGLVKFNKIGPTLNQLNVEDAPYLDDLLEEYYSRYYIPYMAKKKVFSILDIIIWKNENFFTYIEFRPHSFEGVFKLILDSTRKEFNSFRGSALFGKPERVRTRFGSFSLCYTAQQT
jgi:hypothetical protein